MAGATQGPGGGGSRTPEWWPLYFHEEVYDVKDRRAELVTSMVEFFLSGTGSQLLRVRSNENASEELVLSLDYVETRSLAAEVVPDLIPALEFSPEEALTCVAAAAHQACLGPEGQERHPNLHPYVKETRVTVWLFNHPDASLPFRGVKSSTIGRLVSVRGTAVRIGGVRPLVRFMCYKCAKCGESTRVRFPNGICKPPAVCGADGCKSRKLEEQRATAECGDLQRMRLQEGRIPRTLEVDLTGALIDAVRTGDVVTVVGIVKAISIDAENGKSASAGPNSGMHRPYVHAVSVAVASGRRGTHDEEEGTSAGALAGSLRRSSFGGGAGSVPGGPCAAPSAQFSSRDLEFIARFSTETAGDTFRLLVNSLCPAIYGHELVKAAIVLALFGGVRKFPDAQETVPIRGDTHVLIVGDPGLGKSQMLQAAAAAAPRGVYVCGATLSSAGLTVSVARDPATGEFAIEAGAVVLADRGLCAVDEFDKMTAHHQALLEVMEQQSVSVAKAGISASVPARTTVVAASNPVGGSYNRAKTVSENLKISSAMLSRFDLTFILEDKGDEEHDALLTAHVMASHGAQARAQGARRALLEATRRTGDGYLLEDAATAAAAAAGAQAPRPPLRQALRPRPGDDTLPVQLLRKYVAYARRYCAPRLLPEAHTVLRTFFLELRSRASAGDTLPVTARQLESLIRLAEARARCELRSEVTAADASDAVELMKESLFDSLQNQFGFTDFGRSGGRSTGNKETRQFLGRLEQLSKERGQPFFSIAELVTVIDDMRLPVRDVHDFIEKLNDMGDILKQGSKYRLRCSEWGPSQQVPENGPQYGGSTQGGGRGHTQQQGGRGTQGVPGVPGPASRWRPPPG